jgi:hypothetical protein
MLIEQAAEQLLAHRPVSNPAVGIQMADSASFGKLAIPVAGKLDRTA